MSTPPRRPSMADVAALAGVSYQTVSRVLNEPERVRESTQERVRDAIAELGFRPNRAARELKTTRSSLIGVMTDGSGLFGPSETTTAIETAARRAGYAVLLTTVAGEADGRELGGELLDSGADGILVVAGHDAMIPAVEAAARSTPVLAVTADPLDVPGVRTIGVDQPLGARQVVEHLATTGRRSVVHLAGPSDWADARARRSGFEQALEGSGIDGAVIPGGDWSPLSGARLTEELLRAGSPPEAIFAANDLMAIGVIHALSRAGLRAGEDVAVVGFDDVVPAAFLLPPLSTVSQPFALLGRTALELLLSDLGGGADGAARPDPEGGAVPLAPQLVVRESSAR
ncbi:LacI family DNA-binding transcriptional regulator [Brachybacterium rhamnosum]|uniref:LacI family DNA-binding transcriptional regulator n=1 Tax=Brachybacterium rhamnosum TaxID=173361 RepID=A0ABW4PX03_9MICO